MLSAQQLFFFPHKGKYMQTPQRAKLSPPPLGLAGQRRVEGVLQGPSEGGLSVLRPPRLFKP